MRISVDKLVNLSSENKLSVKHSIYEKDIMNVYILKNFT